MQTDRQTDAFCENLFFWVDGILKREDVLKMGGEGANFMQI